MSGNEICDLNRLPLGLSFFSNIRKSKMIYVDKTGLIAKIAGQRTPIFFSRPRRFGKSLLINTLKSLFADGLKYFSNLEIEKIWKDKQYKVVHIDFSSIADNKGRNFSRSLSKRIIRQFSINDICLDDRMKDQDPDDVLDEIAQKLEDNSIVLLIDEYDAPLTHHINRKNDVKNIMSILNNFYSTIKQYTDKFRLIFITGVTRVSHVSIFSAFNNLLDLSLKNEFNSLLGFTRSDLTTFFDPYITNASSILRMRKEELYRRMEQYYNGFQFSLGAEETVYNPWSVLSFLRFPEDGFKNYWFKSAGSSSLLMKYLKKDSFSLNNYDENDLYISEDSISDRYDIFNIPSKILLFQTGYFSIRKKN